MASKCVENVGGSCEVEDHLGRTGMLHSFNLWGQFEDLTFSDFLENKIYSEF